MNVPKELVEQWLKEAPYGKAAIYDIAQRAAEWGAEQREKELLAVSMEPVAEVESDGVLRFKKIDRRYQVGDKLYLSPRQQQPVSMEPLTQAAVVEAFCKLKHETQYVSVFDSGVRFAEKHYGIGEVK